MNKDEWPNMILLSVANSGLLQPRNSTEKGYKKSKFI